MRKAIAVIISLIFVFAVTAVSFAAEKAVTAETAPVSEKVSEKKADKKQITGDVTAVDAAAKTITVKKAKKEVIITIDEKTKIVSGKDKKTLADIKIGDKVTVKYEAAEGGNIAKSVELKSAPEKKAAGY